MALSPYFRLTLILALAEIGLSACSVFSRTGELPPIGDFKEQLAAHPVFIDLPSGKQVGAFAQCMAPLSAQLKPKLEQLMTELAAQGEKSRALEHLRLFGSGFDLGAGTATDVFPEHLDALFARYVDGTLVPSAQDPARKQFAERLAADVERFKAKVQTHEPLEPKASIRAEAYLSAYFGDVLGRALAEKPSGQAEKSALRGKVAKALKRSPNDPAIGKALDEILAGLPQDLDAQSIAATHQPSGFIARDGTRYAFPGVTADASGAAIDHSQVGADIIRIILESLRDTYAPLPVLASATAGTADAGFSGADIFVPESRGFWHWAGDGSILPFAYTLSAEDFRKIEAKARGVEASVAGLVGKAIRGGSWGSLNNEAIAKFVETAAGVLARQSTERAEWCERYSRAAEPAEIPEPKLSEHQALGKR